MMRAIATAVPLPADYRNFHLWMLLPFAITLLGFSYSYFSKLGEATFHQHVHGLSATLWYLLVLVQPWLITRRRDAINHRLLGAVGLVLAGMVTASALTIIPKNIDNVATLPANGFFNPTFAYFACIIDVVLIAVFAVSVVMAVVAMKRRDLSGHVQWLMASVFAVLSPALARMFGIGWIAAHKGDLAGISLVALAVPSMFVMLGLAAVYFHRFGSLRHPAFWLLVVAHLSYLFVVPIGDSEAVRAVLTAVFR